jgi:hypothetical protein
MSLRRKDHRRELAAFRDGVNRILEVPKGCKLNIEIE